MIKLFNNLHVSFRNAFKGLYFLFKEERNARIHVFATIAVIFCGIYFQLDAIEWALIVFAICLVLILEAINTVFENLMDYISTDQHQRIGKKKDLVVGAVLIAALGAFVIGCLVFIPKLL